MRVPFFNIIIHKEDEKNDMFGLCAGFENRSWRKEQLANHLINYIPEFALPYSEFSAIDGNNMIRMVKNAVENIYKSGKYKNRGEFGELMLHSIIREVCQTIPAISKIYYKDGANETVKGFDAVHVVDKDGELELWLGEVKFYKEINSAIRDVVKEIFDHIESDYLRGEFLAITNKIDNAWPFSEKLKRLIDPNVSLDEIFDRACIPVLLTYDSSVLERYEKHTDEYEKEITNEFESLYAKFAEKIFDRVPLTIHLFLFPMNTKEELVKCFDKKLKAWQQL